MALGSSKQLILKALDTFGGPVSARRVVQKMGATGAMREGGACVMMLRDLCSDGYVKRVRGTKPMQWEITMMGRKIISIRSPMATS